MNCKTLALVGFLLLAVLAGCGHSTSTPAAPVNSTAPTDAEIPVTLNGATQVVQVTANDSMKFSGDRFTVKTGQPVQIELTNVGQKPRDQMAHDMVILKPGTDVMTFNLLCAQAKADNYLPKDQMGPVIAHTNGLAGPGETVEADFTAPAPGQYPFLCNFPGHYAAGMRGTMTVTP